MVSAVTPNTNFKPNMAFMSDKKKKFSVEDFLAQLISQTTELSKNYPPEIFKTCLEGLTKIQKDWGNLGKIETSKLIWKFAVGNGGEILASNRRKLKLAGKNLHAKSKEDKEGAEAALLELIPQLKGIFTAFGSQVLLFHFHDVKSLENTSADANTAFLKLLSTFILELANNWQNLDRGGYVVNKLLEKLEERIAAHLEEESQSMQKALDAIKVWQANMLDSKKTTKEAFENLKSQVNALLKEDPEDRTGLLCGELRDKMFFVLYPKDKSTNVVADPKSIFEEFNADIEKHIQEKRDKGVVAKKNLANYITGQLRTTSEDILKHVTPKTENVELKTKEADPVILQQKSSPPEPPVMPSERDQEPVVPANEKPPPTAESLSSDPPADSNTEETEKEKPKIRPSKAEQAKYDKKLEELKEKKEKQTENLSKLREKFCKPEFILNLYKGQNTSKTINPIKMITRAAMNSIRENTRKNDIDCFQSFIDKILDAENGLKIEARIKLMRGAIFYVKEQMDIGKESIRNIGMGQFEDMLNALEKKVKEAAIALEPPVKVTLNVKQTEDKLKQDFCEFVNNLANQPALKSGISQYKLAEKILSDSSVVSSNSLVSETQSQQLTTIKEKLEQHNHEKHRLIPIPDSGAPSITVAHDSRSPASLSTPEPDAAQPTNQAQQQNPEPPTSTN